jgi:hypothetical protein
VQFSDHLSVLDCTTPANFDLSRTDLMVSEIQNIAAEHSFNEMDGIGILGKVMQTERLPSN